MTRFLNNSLRSAAHNPILYSDEGTRQLQEDTVPGAGGLADTLKYSKNLFQVKMFCLLLYCVTALKGS